MCSPQIHRSRHTLLLRRRPLNDRLTSLRFAFVEPSTFIMTRVEPRTRIGLNGISPYIQFSVLCHFPCNDTWNSILYKFHESRQPLPSTPFHCKGEKKRRKYIDVEFRSLRKGSEDDQRGCFFLELPVTIIKVNIHSFARERNSFASTRT